MAEPVWWGKEDVLDPYMTAQDKWALENQKSQLESIYTPEAWNWIRSLPVDPITEGSSADPYPGYTGVGGFYSKEKRGDQGVFDNVMTWLENLIGNKTSPERRNEYVGVMDYSKADLKKDILPHEIGHAAYERLSVSDKELFNRWIGEQSAKIGSTPSWSDSPRAEALLANRYAKAQVPGLTEQERSWMKSPTEFYAALAANQADPDVTRRPILDPNHPLYNLFSYLRR